ncbi:MAG: YIP1 family protein [Acidimicrobiia bacterium]|nr:YIP1 family protein [Acidimicrobiia bacterium]
MSATLQQRVTGILTSPQTEWPRIAAEAETVSGLYSRYIVLLAGIGPVALIIRYPGVSTLIAGIAQFVMQMAAMIICAKVIAWLAPKFQSTGDTVQALKLVTYANTPSWVAGISNLIPFLGLLVSLIAGLYSIYLYYLGLPSVLKTPDGQVLPFMIVSAIAIIVVFVVLTSFLAMFGIVGMMRMV